MLYLPLSAHNRSSLATARVLGQNEESDHADVSSVSSHVSITRCREILTCCIAVQGLISVSAKQLPGVGR
jgi:hypothetical protein